MNRSRRYLLLVESVADPDLGPSWRFVLCEQSTGQLHTAQDREPGCDLGRSTLLALVRGLEALPEPAHLTVICADRHVRYGLERGVRSWSANDWKWERFGRLVTVRDDDLWQRVEQALQIHRVDCRSWRVSVTDHSPAAVAATRPAIREKATDCAMRADTPSGAFSFEPALLVVRKPRRVLRFDHQATRTRAPSAVCASVG